MADYMLWFTNLQGTQKVLSACIARSRTEASTTALLRHRMDAITEVPHDGDDLKKKQACKLC